MDYGSTLAHCSGRYCLGIDGGGTKTVFRLTDENGQVLNSVYKGSSNPNDIGIGRTMALLREGITEILGEIPYSSVTVFAGISGGGLTGGNAEILNRFLREFGFYAFENGSDVENLVALADYEQCVLVIMGTGFIVYALDGERRKRISGWGQLFDEGGSGYTLGRDAITAVLCAGDGSGRQTALSELLTARLGETAETHLAEFYRGGKKYIASFASLVFEAASLGDTVALEILNKNASFAAEKIRTGIKALCRHSQDGDVPVLFSGGISEKRDVLFPLIEKHLSDVSHRLIKIKGEPIDGAIRRAEQILKRKLQGGCSQ